MAKQAKGKGSTAPKKSTQKFNEAQERIRRLIRERGDQLLALPGVTSIGTGYKRTGGVVTQQLALQFSVGRKIALQTLEDVGAPVLPKSIPFEGVEIPTDVIQRNFQTAYTTVQLEAKSPRKSRLDPIQGGISVSHIAGTAGTIGCIVKDQASGAPVVLSNWHVLCGAKGKVGDTIVQPGPYDDSDTDANRLGKLIRSHLGVAGDCAVASIEGRKVKLEELELGTKVMSVGKPDLGDIVVKSGRTTGVTFGKVSRIDAMIKMPYDGLGEQVIGGFEIEPWDKRPAESNEISRGGDSGSAWFAVDPKSGKPTSVMLGLHFGGDADGSEEEFALACYAHSVYQKLGVEPYAENAPERVRVAEDAGEGYRTGFDPDFLSFTVPDLSFTAAMKKRLHGLDGDLRLNYCHYSVWLDGKRKLPAAVAWNVDGGQKKSLSRKGINFVKDERGDLADYQWGDELYEGNDLDRGHVARRDDLVWGTPAEARRANIDSFFFTNMTPQHKAFNQSQLKGKWGQLENAILDEVVVRDLRVSLMGGPVLDADDPKYRGAQLPREFWKVVFFTDDDDGTNKARAFILTQADLLKKLGPEALELDEFRWYRVPLTEIETRTGVKFDAALHAIDAPVTQAVGSGIVQVETGRFFAV